jgi:hypothetical protein
MQVPIILLGDRGDTHDAEHRLLAQAEPHQEFHELLCVHPVRLSSPLAPIDLDARGIDNIVAYLLGLQPTVQPERFASRLVTAHDDRVLRQPETPLRNRDFPNQSQGVSREKLHFTRALHESGRKRQAPLAQPEVERHTQHSHRFATILHKGRWHRKAPSRKRRTSR